MRAVEICPHCGNSTQRLTSISERYINGEPFLNACEYCFYDGIDIKSIDLSTMYTKFNFKYFNNTLPPVESVTIQWNSRIKIGGRCFYEDKVIELGYYYISKHIDEFENIFVHEMLHLIHNFHDKNFKLEAARITDLGLPISVYTNHNECTQYKWKYICTICGHEYLKKRKLSNEFLCSKCYSELKEFPIIHPNEINSTFLKSSL